MATGGWGLCLRLPHLTGVCSWAGRHPHPNVQLQRWLQEEQSGGQGWRGKGCHGTGGVAERLSRGSSLETSLLPCLQPRSRAGVCEVSVQCPRPPEGLGRADGCPALLLLLPVLSCKSVLPTERRPGPTQTSVSAKQGPVRGGERGVGRTPRGLRASGQTRAWRPHSA